MSQLSQFDKEATIGDGGRIRVSGPVAPATDEQGQVVERQIPVRFHFMVVKDGHVLHGESTSLGNRWSGTTSIGAEGLTPGPAMALGFAVETKTSPTATFETASWVETIEVKAAG